METVGRSLPPIAGTGITVSGNTVSVTASTYDDFGDAATAQSNAESFATAADTTVLSTAESYAASAASTAQSNAESFATSADTTVLSTAETYAASAATTAQSNAESFATSADSTVLSSAEVYAAAQAAAAQSAAEAASIPLTYLDTDGTMAADSDTHVPSQKAIVTYVTSHAGGGSSIPDYFSYANFGGL